MIVRLIKKRKIYNFTLPNEVSGNYWITDNDYLGNVRNLINVEEYKGEWKIKSDFETKIMSGSVEVDSAILKDYGIYFLKINTDNEYVILYCSPTIEKNTVKLKIKEDGEYLIGTDTRSAILYKHQLVSRQHARLIYSEKKWMIQDLTSKYGTYVNNASVTSQALEYGDIVFIMGLKIIVMKDALIINTIGGNVSYDTTLFEVEGNVVQKMVAEDNPDEE